MKILRRRSSYTHVISSQMQALDAALLFLILLTILTLLFSSRFFSSRDSERESQKALLNGKAFCSSFYDDNGSERDAREEKCNVKRVRREVFADMTPLLHSYSVHACMHIFSALLKEQVLRRRKNCISPLFFVTWIGYIHFCRAFNIKKTRVGFNASFWCSFPFIRIHTWNCFILLLL